MEGTVLCAANHAPLTPISFLERTALVYPDRPAVVAAAQGHAHAAAPPRTWRETRHRCLRLAAALAGLGVARRDVATQRSADVQRCAAAARALGASAGRSCATCRTSSPKRGSSPSRPTRTFPSRRTRPRCGLSPTPSTDSPAGSRRAHAVEIPKGVLFVTIPKGASPDDGDGDVAAVLGCITI